MPSMPGSGTSVPDVVLEVLELVLPELVLVPVLVELLVLELVDELVLELVELLVLVPVLELVLVDEVELWQRTWPQ